ncbi:MAG: DUF1573 domain-containing protein [Candidatus Kapabacteria bacterium]|nr:DUF1573 domain-containing protein [Candidatus Kapabacteria bacterium]
MAMVNIRNLRTVLLYLAPMVMFAQPRLQMQSVVDWGMVTPSGSLTKQQSVSYRVPLKNIGDKTLVVSSVRPQCGCTSAPLERDTLQPGEETSMNITLTLPAGSGVIDKYVTVFCNDSAKSHVLKLRAEVQRPLQLSSSFLGFNQGMVGQPTRSKIELISNIDDEVRITVEPKTQGLTVVGPSVLTLRKGLALPIEVEYVPAKAGTFKVELLLRTSLPDYETIDVSGFGMADPSVK